MGVHRQNRSAPYIKSTEICLFCLFEQLLHFFQKTLGRCVVRLHEVQGAAGLEPVDLLLVERVVDLDFEGRSSCRGLDLQGQRRPLRESAETLDGNPAIDTQKEGGVLVYQVPYAVPLSR